MLTYLSRNDIAISLIPACILPNKFGMISAAFSFVVFFKPYIENELVETVWRLYWQTKYGGVFFKWNPFIFFPPIWSPNEGFSLYEAWDFNSCKSNHSRIFHPVLYIYIYKNWCRVNGKPFSSSSHPSVKLRLWASPFNPRHVCL